MIPTEHHANILGAGLKLPRSPTVTFSPRYIGRPQRIGQVFLNGSPLHSAFEKNEEKHKSSLQEWPTHGFMRSMRPSTGTLDPGANAMAPAAAKTSSSAIGRRKGRTEVANVAKDRL